MSSFASEALTLTILSSHRLKNLKRRGFNVDRILNARKAEREAADQRMREERLQAQLLKASEPSSQLDKNVEELSEMFPDADPDFLRTLLQTQNPPRVENAANQLLASPQYPKRRDLVAKDTKESNPWQQVGASAQRQATPSQQGGLFSNLRRQFTRSEQKGVSQPLPPPPSLTSDSPSRPERNSGMVPSPASRPGSTPTPTDAVRANLTRAIQVRHSVNLMKSSELINIPITGCSTRNCTERQQLG